MKNIQPVLCKTEGGKRVGRGCQARIDQASGCVNKCVGCYAKRVTRCGDAFDTVIEREFDTQALRASMRDAKAKGVHASRCGSVCDPGHNEGTLRTIIDIATSEGMMLVVTTKSLTYSEGMADALIRGGHMLQVSLGMISEAVGDAERYGMATAYFNHGVDVTIRITTDATVPPSEYYKHVISGPMPVILTPMRFYGRPIMAQYGADDTNYTHHKGYMRPNFVDAGWDGVEVCGEVGGEVFCANCLVPKNIAEIVEMRSVGTERIVAMA